MKNVETYTAHNQSGILLNANEMSFNQKEEIIEEMQEALKNVLFNRYPDDSCHELLSAYANKMNLNESQVLAGNGSDQMLGLLIGTFLSKGKTLYTLTPDFSMYDYYASSYEADIEKFPLTLGSDFDLEAFIEKGQQIQPNMILFSNPNNPTGQCLAKKDIVKILEAFSDIPVVIDEAYMEFGNESMLDEIENYSNLYVTRTLSKAYGAAGLRLGFLISSKDNMDYIRPRKVVYALSSVSQKLGKIIIEHMEEFEPVIEEIKKQRDEMIEKGKDFKHLTLHPSQGNFICIQSANTDALNEAFKNNNIVIRDYMGKDYIRITVGTKEENDLVMNILKGFEESL